MQAATDITCEEVRQGVAAIRTDGPPGPNNVSRASMSTFVEVLRRSEEDTASAGAGIPTSTGHSLAAGESSKDASDDDPSSGEGALGAGETGNDPPPPG